MNTVTSGTRKRIWQKVMWILVYNFSGARWKRHAPSLCKHFATRAESFWWMTHDGKSTETNLMNSYPKKESVPGFDGISWSFCRCAGGFGSQFLFNADKHVLEGGTILALFAESRNVFIPKSSDENNNGIIVRSPEAPRSLTLCKCDFKKVATAICRDFNWYTGKCVHFSQRCIPSKQMMDNIFQIEMLPMPMWRPFLKSGISLSVFAATCFRFRKDPGTILHGQGVRQDFPASGFLFAMVFDPIFRWFQEGTFLRPVQRVCRRRLCGCPIFRCLMTLLAVVSILWTIQLVLILIIGNVVGCSVSVKDVRDVIPSVLKINVST